MKINTKKLVVTIDVMGNNSTIIIFVYKHIAYRSWKQTALLDISFSDKIFFTKTFLAYAWRFSLFFVFSFYL